MKHKFFKRCWITLVNILFLFLLLFYPEDVSANVLFSDNFESGLTSAWQIVKGPWITKNIDGNTWLSINTPPQQDYEIQAGEFSWTDYELELKIDTLSGTDKNIFFRVQDERTIEALPGHNLPVSYGLHITNRLIQLTKYNRGERIKLKSSNVNLPNNTPFKLKVVARNNETQIFVNNSDSPILEYKDNSNPYLTGRFALATIAGNSGINVLFDDILINKLFEILPVPDLKQFWLPWSEQTYDHADYWAEEPYIKNYGCSLTSAAMVLQYFGFQTDPEELNNWLKNEPDGYLDNGLLNWIAVSRYSKSLSNEELPTLEFKKTKPILEEITQSLEEKNPVIYGMTNHFVVAKGKSDSDYIINDPASSIKKLSEVLNVHGNEPSSLNIFTPSNTDLSYILLTTESTNELEVYDPENNNLSDNIYLEGPIALDLSESPYNSSPLKIFAYPKPKNGIYRLIISAKGTYKFSSYIYNTSGLPTIQSFQGNIYSNRPEEYLIDLTNRNITRKTTLSSILNDIDNLYYTGLFKNYGLYVAVQRILSKALKG